MENDSNLALQKQTKNSVITNWSMHATILLRESSKQ